MSFSIPHKSTLYNVNTTQKSITFIVVDELWALFYSTSSSPFVANSQKLVGSVVGGINICNSQYLRQKAGIRLFHQRKWNKSEDVIVYIHIWRKALLGTMGLLQPKKPFVHTEWKYTIFGLGRLVLSILHECEHKTFLLCCESK